MSQLIYCPICGHVLGEREEGGRIRQACDNCGYVHYVNPVPAVGILIEMDGGLVLIRRNNPPHRGRWTLPSGFIEADESAEEAAAREAEEETGLKVDIIELAGVNSFPEGPPMSGIMIFFRARPVGGELRGGDDASEAKVFQPNEIPLIPFRTHREAVAQWLARQQLPPSEHIQSEDNEHPGFTIRAAEAGDVNEIIALLELIPANRTVGRDEWREIIQRFHEQDSIKVFVAVATQQPPLLIGFIAMSVMRSLTEGWGIINEMAVLPTFQRKGVGAALLEAALRCAERHKLKELLVNAERANDRAKAFYATLGFSQGNFMRIKVR
ncbi:MAG TPA: GNAT family N-acetyltransferase [Oceanobacillus sp.]|nr:GNAT family N-acetyltransferase [Oceanobacillus sp.]